MGVASSCRLCHLPQYPPCPSPTSHPPKKSAEHHSSISCGADSDKVQSEAKQRPWRERLRGSNLFFATFNHSEALSKVWRDREIHVWLTLAKSWMTVFLFSPSNHPGFQIC